jgi:2-haloacid dehalogenase
LLYTEKALGTALTEESRADLMQHYRKLPPFPEVAAGLTSLKAGGHLLAAFSNGEAGMVRAVLEHAKLAPLLDDVVSTDEVKTFKPDPATYAHAAQRLGQAAGAVWLVSSNPFDIIGAKSAGLLTAWVKRDRSATFDPWGVEPDLVVSGLDQLAPLFKSAPRSRT